LLLPFVVGMLMCMAIVCSDDRYLVYDQPL